MTRRVALTQIGDGLISTVLLACHDPAEWETMVFGGKFNHQAERYDSLADALRGHDAWVGKLTRDRLPVRPERDACPLP